jgi:prolyl oligopeptidase
LRKPQAFTDLAVMKHRYLWILFFGFCSALQPVAAQVAAGPEPLPASIQPVKDAYFGTDVIDAYRWLEDGERPDAQEWYQAQYNYAEQTLHRLLSRNAMLARLKELTQESPYRIRSIQRVGNRFFYLKRRAGSTVWALAMRDGLDGIDKQLIDPSVGPLAAVSAPEIASMAISPDGHYLAYELTWGEAENNKVRVFDIKTNKHLGETISQAHLTPQAWLADNRSFLYNKVSAKSSLQLYLSQVSAKPGTDRLVFGDAFAPAGASIITLHASGGSVCANSPWIMASVTATGSTSAAIYVAPLTAIKQKTLPWKRITGLEDQVSTVHLQGTILFGLSTRDAPAGRVLRTSLETPNWAAAVPVLVPDSPTELQSMYSAGDGIYVLGRDGSASRLWQLPLQTGVKTFENTPPKLVPLPEGSAVAEIATEARQPGVFLILHSWIAAPLTYRWSSGPELIETDLQPAGDYDIPDHLATIELKVRSADGVQIPLTMIYRRGLKLNSHNPTLLTAYGAFGRALVPEYDPSELAWIERGGVLAIAHVRGGGEYGEAWHHAGRADKKPAGWQDLVACAQHLIDQHYTTAERLALEGSEAGSIVVAGAMTEKPELFQAVLLDRPLTDLVRYQSKKNAAVEALEYGSLQLESGFRSRLVMSPYHRIKEREHYPATLVVTAPATTPEDVDWQAGKLVAHLQGAARVHKPILLRAEPWAGDAETLRQQAFERKADQLSFLLWQMDNASFQPIVLAKRKRVSKSRPTAISSSRRR